MPGIQTLVPVLRRFAGALLLAACALPQAATAGQLPRLPATPGAAAAAVQQVKATAAVAPVVEYFHAGLNNYFITADPAEQAAVDSGAAGAWARTGNTFLPGGTTPVCRFYGNANINPATGTFYGPNSHFYTADPAECAALKAAYNPNAKSWKFESNDFLTTPAVNGTCPAGLVPVYRAYNNGFARGIDSNHRITSNLAAYQQTVASGWSAEGIVMCAPSSSSVTLPATLTACGDSDCPSGSTTLGSGLSLVNVIVEITNTTTGTIELVIPAGQTFVSTTTEFQDGLAVETLRGTIAPGATARYILHLFCMHSRRHASDGTAVYQPGPATTNPNLLDLINLAAGKLGSAQDPNGIKAGVTQYAVWAVIDNNGPLSATQRNLLVQLYATPAAEVEAQLALYEQFLATLNLPQ